jgi:hypothetical protein
MLKFVAFFNKLVAKKETVTLTKVLNFATVAQLGL